MLVENWPFHAISNPSAENWMINFCWEDRIMLKGVNSKFKSFRVCRLVPFSELH